MEFKIYCIFCFCVLKAAAMKVSRKTWACQPATQRLIIHGKRTTMVLRGLCILYEVCLLKVCYFYFLFFREDISVANKVDGEQRWWPRFGAAPGFCRWLYSLAACLFSPLRFCCLKILCEDKSRGYNIMHCKTS